MGAAFPRFPWAWFGVGAEHLGDPDTVLVADETGDLKKGT
jgi:hypothetical protein